MSREGVIKYQLDHQRQALPDDIDLSDLEHWRRHFHQLGLIARDPSRYEGLGYGNISQRHPLPDNPNAFVISGSQTAHLAAMDREGYALVTGFDIAHNRLSSLGPRPPSSEALTHATIYQHEPTAMAVIHVHDPGLWRAAVHLGLPVTPAGIEYGTVAMAEAIQRVLTEQKDAPCLLSMGGHEDGVIAWGKSLAEAAATLTRYHRLASER